jgi:predicted component of type VI protein secretion system
MNDDLQVALLIAAVIAGLSGWAAIFAWWFRERSKTVRGIKDLRRTNARLQKTLMFTLDKWRDQIMNNQSFLMLEREYADQLATARSVSPQDVKESIRRDVRSILADEDGRPDRERMTPTETRHQLAAAREVEDYARTGRSKAMEFEIEAALRKAA